ncbi:type IV secretion system protein VirB2 [Paraburkholderia fungorum]|jgi:type IV secretion system protein VirB2|uniref:TrbC/VirB2 family protein n=1 Tax=Paraburkholderia fungorum TaxID=134537 RepID=UPI000D065019|nr:TrbC/VirB2 family protein [Paraburkholderia fungorum]PRZ56008.1 type IV secretion system protein VirB2 [Paraburkholderia fungorum]
MKNHQYRIETSFQIVGTCLLALLLADPACAQITSQASTILSDISTGLTAIGVVICTIALMWAGFKMMFQHARFGEIANIFIGSMLVGGASTIAGVLLSGSSS